MRYLLPLTLGALMLGASAALFLVGWYRGRRPQPTPLLVQVTIGDRDGSTTTSFDCQPDDVHEMLLIVLEMEGVDLLDRERARRHA